MAASPELAPDFFDTGAVLAASDYDGTQLRTFEPSPEGIGVNEAYQIAIGEVLGDVALHDYVKGGGHNNRTPTEIVASLVRSTDGMLFELIAERHLIGEPVEDILEGVHAFHRDRRGKLFQPYLIEEKTEIEAATAVMTEAKLRVLTGQVGKRMDDGSMWPRPTAGFLDYTRAVDQAKSEGAPITTAVVSAGHAAFILRTYEIHDIPPPDILITDETIQATNPHIPLSRRSKPAPFPMALLKTQWLKQHGMPADVLRTPDLKEAVDQRITYIGDDRIKDGGLAASSKVTFVSLDDPDDPQPWIEMAQRLGIEMELSDV